MFSVVGGVVGFVALFAGFAPVRFEEGGWGLVVVVMVKVGEDGMEGFSLVSEGNVMATACAFACTAVGDEHDGDEVRKKGFDVGVLEELGDFGGEREGGGFRSAAKELGVAEGAERFVVSTDDVLDGVLGTVFFLGKLEAAFFFASVVTDNLEFRGDVKFALVGGFNAWLGRLAKVVNGAGWAFLRKVGWVGSHGSSLWQW